MLRKSLYDLKVSVNLVFVSIITTVIIYSEPEDLKKIFFWSVVEDKALDDVGFQDEKKVISLLSAS